jgi:uncharacterized membrane protein
LTVKGNGHSWGILYASVSTHCGHPLERPSALLPIDDCWARFNISLIDREAAKMAEPESLATDEALTAHVARHAYDRLIMLSDGIFAIATTLAALEIRLPTGISDPRLAFVDFWVPLVTYAISFGVIAIFWLSSRDLFARLARVTRPVTALTLAMLCLVALIPIAVRAMTEDRLDVTFRFYTVIMFSCGVANAALWAYASFASDVMREEVPKRYRWTRTLGSLALPALFAPLMFVNREQLLGVVLPMAVIVGILRRGVLPRLLKRIFPGDGLAESHKAGPAADSRGSAA